jgi:hypothetical protein
MYIFEDYDFVIKRNFDYMWRFCGVCTQGYYHHEVYILEVISYVIVN